MRIASSLAILGLVWLVALPFQAQPVGACMCAMAHPQTHYCDADYVALIRVLRRSTRLVAQRVVYKVDIKRTYKITQAGRGMLKHSRVATADSESMCGVKLEIGRLYVVAGRSPNLSVCNYAKEYKKMTVIERTGFNGFYAKGCSCSVKPCYGSQCLRSPGLSTACRWSPLEPRKCETEHSACLPTVSGSVANTTICRWQQTVPYKACLALPPVSA